MGKDNKILMNRRHVLKTLSMGAVAYGLAGCTSSPAGLKKSDPDVPAYTGHGKKATWEKVTSPTNVSLIKGNDPSDNTYNSLMNIEDEIMASL